MSKNTPKNKAHNKATKKPAALPETKAQAAETNKVEKSTTEKPAREPREDTKGPHKAKAIAEARAAFKALGLNAPAFFDTVQDGTATEADFKAVKAQTDALKIAVNSLGCHFQPAKEAKAAAK